MECPPSGSYRQFQKEQGPLAFLHHDQCHNRNRPRPPRSFSSPAISHWPHKLYASQRDTPDTRPGELHQSPDVLPSTPKPPRDLQPRTQMVRTDQQAITRKARLRREHNRIRSRIHHPARRRLVLLPIQRLRQLQRANPRILQHTHRILRVRQPPTRHQIRTDARHHPHHGLVHALHAKHGLHPHLRTSSRSLHSKSSTHEHGRPAHRLILHEHIPPGTERPGQRLEQYYISTAQQSEHLLRRIHTRTGTTPAALLHRQRILHSRTHSLLHLLRSDQTIRGANSFPKLGIGLSRSARASAVQTLSRVGSVADLCVCRQPGQCKFIRKGESAERVFRIRLFESDTCDAAGSYGIDISTPDRG